MQKLIHIIVVLASTLLFSGLGLADSNLPTYNTITTKELANPKPGNWLQYRGNYSGWGYSPLKKINSDNVGKLELAWAYTTGGASGGYEAPPIVNDGYMYVTTPMNEVIALNAKTGRQIWNYKYQLPQELMKLHPTNRGVAVYGDNVYMATLDCKLVALDAKTGKVQWTATDGPWKKGYYATVPLLAAKGKVMMGCSGGETGIRGSVSAYNAKTGKREWRFYTVPAPGHPGSNTWPDHNKHTYKHGGGPIWITGSYDPKTNTAFWGTGNPGPWLHGVRKGDNVYTDSVIALDVATGKLKAYFQYNRNDAWDWDEVSTPMLITTQIDGKKTKTVVHAGRDGYLWQLSQEPGKLLDFMNAWSFANNNVFTKINPKTGRVSYDPKRTPGLHHKTHYCPSAWGGKDWPAEAYNPNTKLLYVPANVTMCGYLPKGQKVTYKPGRTYIGFPLGAVMSSIKLPGDPDHVGQLQAWDLSKGKMVWKHNFHGHLWSPLLTTAGNLVFGGGTSDRMFRAFDAKTGEVLWQAPAPSGIIAPPVAYQIDGTEYIAVQAGWGVDAQRVQSQIDLDRNQHTVVPQGGTLLVYKLGK